MEREPSEKLTLGYILKKGFDVSVILSQIALFLIMGKFSISAFMIRDYANGFIYLGISLANILFVPHRVEQYYKKYFSNS